jgi:hypothetical protein
MATSKGDQLAQNIRQKMDELKKLCKGVDESTASRAPDGRWSSKEILSHLRGAEGSGHLPILQKFLAADTPTIDLDIGNPFFSENRARITFALLLTEVEKEYDEISEFVEGLSKEQLDRKAHIPALKNSSLGEYPSLESMVSGLGESHLQFHIDHMREILQALTVPHTP